MSLFVSLYPFSMQQKDPLASGGKAWFDIPVARVLVVSIAVTEMNFMPTKNAVSPS